MGEIALVRPDQMKTAADTLAEAFFDDPLLQIMAPDEKRRAGIGRWFFGMTVRYGARWGQCWCNDDASSAAVWFPPGKTHISTTRMLRVGFAALPFKAGLNGASRFMRALPVTEKFHKAVEGPHWYLMAIGTRVARQGSGQGSALLELGTSQADAAKIPCYLETGTEANVAYYSKRGFEVTGQAEIFGFTLYGMVRQPR